MARWDLPVRSDKVDLLAVPAGFIAPSDSDFKVVLDTAAGEAAWRLLECYSTTGLPFELLVEWSAGSATGAQVRLTVPAAARVSVFARHIRVRAANLANEPSTVAVAVGDTFSDTHNFYEWRGRCEGGTVVQIPVPRFALLAHVHISDRSQLGDTVVSVLDGSLNVRAQFSALVQPPGGIPLGSARRIEVLTPSVADVRALFNLSL